MAQPTSYVTIDIQLIDDFTGDALSAPGGSFFVCTNGTALLPTLYDPDNNFLATTNPKTLINGRIRFAIQFPAGGQPSPPIVDIYGITATGRFFVRRNQTVGDVPNLMIDMNERDWTLVIPYSIGAATAGVEYNTGISMPAGTLMQAEAAVNVLVAEQTGSKTIKFGTLSSQSGGNSAGFINGVGISSAGVQKATITGASQTLGTLLTVVSQATSTLVPEWYPIPATAPLLSYTLLAGSTGASGFIVQPYYLLF